MQAKGFNERIFGIGHFYKFMEVKQYITRMPFRIEYFQQKEVIVHHDRSVEETVYMEILKKFQKENPDVIAFIQIPKTNIAYPILQAKDNDYYLRRSLDLKYDIAGSIFMDYMNDKKMNDDNSVIYGHYIQGMTSMFTALKEFRDQEFAQKNRNFYIVTEDGLREYRIFSVYATPANYDYRTLNFEDKGQKLSYLEKLKEKSDVSLENRNFKQDDTIVTLSTCQYDYEDERLAVHALRVR
ncbi:MAG: class B sortase [Anaerococcus hydrogenalis]|nr:class B sortase [Anaerococcus hydrogenalis]